MDKDVFIKSDIGAQAAWKGFSSQTLYIACLLYTSDSWFSNPAQITALKSRGMDVIAMIKKSSRIKYTYGEDQLCLLYTSQYHLLHNEMQKEVIHDWMNHFNPILNKYNTCLLYTSLQKRPYAILQNP